MTVGLSQYNGPLILADGTRQQIVGQIVTGKSGKCENCETPNRVLTFFEGLYMCPYCLEEELERLKADQEENESE